MIDPDYFIAKAAADRMALAIAGLDADHRDAALSLMADDLEAHDRKKQEDTPAQLANLIWARAMAQQDKTNHLNSIGAMAGGQPYTGLFPLLCPRWFW